MTWLSCRFMAVAASIALMPWDGHPPASPAAAAPLPPGIPDGADNTGGATDGLAQAAGSILIDDFEDVSDWLGLEIEQSIVREGEGAGRWANHTESTSARKDFDAPVDASGMSHLQFWLYSDVANGASVELILDSDNDADASGWDYFIHGLTVDWTGWRFFRIALDDFGVARRPVGWTRVNHVRFAASGWGHEPRADTVLIVDEMRFVEGVLSEVVTDTAWDGGDFLYRFRLRFANSSDSSRSLDLVVEPEIDSPLRHQVSEPELPLPGGGSAEATVTVVVPRDIIRPERYLETHHLGLLISEGDSVVDGTTLAAAVPLPPRERPRLLLDSDDLGRIADWAARHAWAADRRNEIVLAADGWPESFQQRYDLSRWALPPEGGQWTLWYTCPVHGVRLRYEPPSRHVCPVDDQTFGGWPYDQVIYAWMHGDLARAAQELGLAYQITGESTYSESAAEILLAYASAYLDYPVHNVQGDPGGSGAHVLSQTLDESGWLVRMAWAYDMVAESPALTDADRALIEQRLLRPAARIIGRNQAGLSNWQSWHNAALASVGFAVDDPVLVAQAVRDPANGFEFQMASSVTSDGFWYEGSWGYHFFALRAHVYLAEMASRAGLDPYGEPALRGMFTAPPRFAMPDGTMPPFNDSGVVRLATQDGLYESAFLRYADDVLTTVLGQRARRREALLWGSEQVPASSGINLVSELFPDAGYAVLRADDDGSPVYAALDYGPHGGGHGHYDKLGIVLHARGTTMAVDPGTQSYAAPTHKTWDKETVAHNTIVVDGRTQAAATGGLHRFAALPGMSMAAADAGEAAAGADLLRTLLVSPEYIVDRFRVRAIDDSEHTFDWVYHGFGSLSAALPRPETVDLPDTDGYQHLSDVAAARTAEDWQARFDLAPPIGEEYGSTWSSEAGIDASFTRSDDTAYGGTGSGRLAYDFTARAGYVIYGTEQPDPADEAPDELRLAVHGDGSGNELALRIYDSTNERFVRRLGAVDWTGWRLITATNVLSWSHYLGNDDGLFDPPASSVAIQLSYEDGSPSSGRLYVDDIALGYPTGGTSLVEDFEHEPAGMRLWMLGSPDSSSGDETIVATANGLGPDLLEPVPLVLARRTARETTFTSLLEPMSDDPRISAFAAVPTTAEPDDEAIAVGLTADAFSDLVLAVADGAPGRMRTFGAAACDGVMCLVRHAGNGRLARLVLAEATTLDHERWRLVESSSRLAGLQVDYSADGRHVAVVATDPLTSTVRLLAPDSVTVDLNASPVAYTRDGDVVVIGAPPSILLPLVSSRAAWLSGPIDSGRHGWPGHCDMQLTRACPSRQARTTKTVCP